MTSPPSPLKYDSNISYRETLKESGADLSDYHDQLAKERSSRTLNFRRQTRPLISSILGKSNNSLLNSLKPNYFDQIEIPYLDIQYFSKTILNGTESQIIELTKNIINLYQNSPKLIINLITNVKISEPIITSLQNTQNSNIIIVLLEFISIIYPKCNLNQEKFIDDGLIYVLLDFLSSKNQNILINTFSLIGNISEISYYSRDSVLCTGLHIDLINFINNLNDDNLIKIISHSLQQIFSNPNKIDTIILNSCIEPLCNLLYLPDLISKRFILYCLVSITNKKPSLVYKLYDLGLFREIISFLNEELLIPATLQIIGNMCVSQISYISILIQSNLLEILKNLLTTQYCPESLWVLSNLVESFPQTIIYSFDNSIIEVAIEIGSNGSFDEKKEAAFFISTLILFSSLDSVEFFVREDVIDIIEEMFGCGISLIVLRCLDACLKLYHLPDHISHQFLSSLSTETAQNSLILLSNSGFFLISERANILLDLLISKNSFLQE